MQLIEFYSALKIIFILLSAFLCCDPEARKYLALFLFNALIVFLKCLKFCGDDGE